MVIICDANKFNIFLQDCGVALLVANKYCWKRDYLQYSTQHRSWLQKFSCSLSTALVLFSVHSTSSSSHNFLHHGSLIWRISSLWDCCALAITGADLDIKPSRTSGVTSWSFGGAEKHVFRLVRPFVVNWEYKMKQRTWSAFSNEDVINERQSHQATDLYPRSVWPAVLLSFVRFFLSSCWPSCEWQAE